MVLIFLSATYGTIMGGLPEIFIIKEPIFSPTLIGAEIGFSIIYG